MTLTIACTKIKFVNDCYDFFSFLLFDFLDRLVFDIPHLFSSHNIPFDEGRQFIFGISFFLFLA